MATAAKNKSLPPADDFQTARRPGDVVLRAFDAVFRFLASLKLAVICLITLAGVLAYATFFESWYGTAAVQEWVYKSRGFALLLAFLGANILCAALIRFPWRKRQTGFVITHAGLLIVLAGSWISFLATLDGQVGIVEGATSSELVMIDHAQIYVRPVDKAGETTNEYMLPFYPGAFNWDNARLAAESARQSPLLTPLAYGFSGLLAAVLLGFVVYWRTNGRERLSPPLAWATVAGLAVLLVFAVSEAKAKRGPRTDVLSTPNDPFRLVVKDYLAASTPPKFAPVSGPDGVPMVKLALLVKPPRSDAERDVLRDPARGIRPWLVASNPRVRRDTRDVFPAQVAFQFLDSAEKVDDFLAVPKDPLKDEVARLHYTDRLGKERVYEWTIDGREGKTVVLPDSDLKVTFAKQAEVPVGQGADPSGSMMQAVGEEEIHVVQFRVQKGDGPAIEHYGWGSLPMIPSLIPSRDHPDAKPLVRISYYHPPHIARVAMQGRASVIEVAGTADGKLYYRAFSREGLRGKGGTKVGETVRLVSGPNQPVSVAFRVDEYLTSGVEREVCEPIEMPKGRQADGIPACLVEMTVDGVKREFWLRRSTNFNQAYQTVTFPSGTYKLSLDFIREPLGFDLKLVDFNEGKDPGAQQSRSFESKVELTDSSRGVEAQPRTISMNRPLWHRYYTFYQTNFIHLEDESRQRTGEIMSVFQTRYDPVWGITYFGCLLVVLGTFVQFYMRAGVFTDGGKKERERTTAREKASGPGTNGHSPSSADAGTLKSTEVLSDFDEL